MTDVDEIVNCVVSISSKVVNEAADLVLQAIRALINMRSSQSATYSQEKEGLLDKGKDAVTRHIPGAGKYGNVSLREFNKQIGQSSIVPIDREDLKELQKELNKRGVTYHVIRQKDSDSYDVLFGAKDYELMESALKAVGRQIGISETLLQEAEKPELDSEAIEQHLSTESGREFLANQSFGGLNWELTTQENSEPTFTAERGIHDLSATPQGKWSVSVMGRTIAEGINNNPGTYGAMIKALNISKGIENKLVLDQGVGLGKSIGVAKNYEALGNNAPRKSIEEVAHLATEKAAQLNAERVKPEMPKQSHTLKR